MLFLSIDQYAHLVRTNLKYNKNFPIVLDVSYNYPIDPLNIVANNLPINKTKVLYDKIEKLIPSTASFDFYFILGAFSLFGHYKFENGTV